MRARIGIFAMSLCGFALVAGSARARAMDVDVESDQLEDNQAPPIKEIESGVSLGVDSGAMLLFGPASSNRDRQTAWARTLGVSMAVDLGARWSAGLTARGLAVNAPDGYLSPTGRRGDFSGLFLGVFARGVLVGTERVKLWGRAGAGAAVMSPDGAFEEADLVGSGGLELEYFTRLRHFSVGAATSFWMGARHLGPAIEAAPFVRYTF